MRKPTPHEQLIFAKLLSIPFPGRGDVETMLSTALVSPIDSSGSLMILCREAEAAATVKRVPVEAEMADQDGVMVRVLLHVLEGRPHELEVYKDDGSPIIFTVDAKRLQVIILPPHPAA